ncbi:MAG: DUF11 domain-containing protein, partial [Bacilli bacterium]|nr:DUF11 domain-containing protein [Bacilli bacterium]
MKLRKILMIIVCIFLMPIIVSAEELRPYQKALKETAGAFLRKVPYVRYSNAKDMKKITPEMASEQNNIYTECAAFVDEVYREALGMNLKHSTLHMAGCAYIQKDAHPEVVRKIWGPDDEGFSEQPPSITLNSMLEYIKTGDVVIGVQYDSKAHTTMVYDINGSQTTLINSNEWGDGTNLSNKVDVHLYYDSMGGVGLWNLEEKIQSYFKNCKYVFIIRPVVEDGNQIKQIIDFNGTGHGNSTDLYDLTKYPCNEYASSKQNVSIPDTTTCRLNHPGMSITKTVSAKDKNIINKSEVEVGDLLTYKIVIKNNSNSDYTDLNVVENIPANVIYKSSSSGSSVDNGKVSWSNFTVPKNDSKELTYTVKVKKEALGTTISSTGSVCSITTAEITNSVGKKLHSIDKNSIIQSFNNSDKTNSKELINEIYYNTTGISNLLGNFDLRDLVVYTNERKNEEGKPIRDEDGKTIAEVIYDSKGGSNPKAISLSQDNSLYDIVYNNYYGGIVEDGTYTEDDVTKTQYKMHYWEYNWLMSPLRNKYSSSEPNNPAKDERYSPFYLTPSSNYRSAMADTIIKDHFETGDILITLVDGVQHEYIYLEDKFYNKSGSFPETLDSNNYNFNKLFMSDRYVILRPALTMQAKLSKPHLDSPAEYTYTGNEIIPAIYDYEEELMTSSGTKNATNVGNYSMTISLKDKINYMWTDKNAVDIVLNWEIVKADRPAPTVIDYSAQYDGHSHTVDATASEGTLVYSIDRLTWSDTKPTRTEVGKTTVYVKAIGDSNHNDSEIIESTIEITKKQMPKSSLANTRYEYREEEITPEIINYDSNIMDLSGNISGTDPNNYSMIVSLKDKLNYEWEDETTSDVTLNWEINRKKLVKPTISIPEYTYTGETVTPVISNYSSDKMRKNGVSSATNAGNYTVSIELRDKVRYVWQDESDFDVEINWKINKTDREKPTVQSYSKAYDGAPHSVTVTGEGTPEYSLDGLTWSEEKPTRTEVGTTTVYVRIKEAQNYNASEVVEGSITIIAKTKIAKPIMNQIEYTYNGEEITPVISNYDSNVMNISGTASSINSGNYSVKIELKDKENNQWADGTNSDITLNWKINKANRNAPTVESYSGIYDGTSHSIEVTGEGVIGYSIDGLVWTEEKPTRTEVGTVTVYVKVFGDSNHNESEVVSGTITIIAKTQKVKPTILINEYTYSGEEITPTISNYDSNVMNISGTTSSINSENYSVTISLKNKAIYEWADGTNTDITLNWKINKAKKENPIVVSYGDVYDGDAHTIEATGEGIIKYSLDKETWSEEKPTRTEVGITTVYVKVVGDNNYNDSDIVEGTIAIASKTQLVKPTMSITEYTYTGEEITPIINNYDGEKIELSGIRKETKVGNYSVTFGIKDKKNYEWADGTKEDVTLNWKINKANRNAPIVQSYSGIYDGTSHSIEVTGEGVIGYSIDGLVWVDT